MVHLHMELLKKKKKQQAWVNLKILEMNNKWPLNKKIKNPAEQESSAQ